MLDSVVALVAPPACLVCRAPVRPGRSLCGGCTTELSWIEDPCRRCALPRPCGAPCPAQRAAFAAAWAPLAFEGPARGLVHALKFRGRTAAARTMAAQMAANVPPDLLTDIALLVPVPTNPASVRDRGFDHTRLLARALSKRTNLPFLDALSHANAPQRQLGKARSERRKGPRIEPKRPASGAVAVVDDVHTTGATLDSCARALHLAGAERVIALTYARTMG